VVDDYKYSVGRIVVYRHPNPERESTDYGPYGPDRTLGVVRSVELGVAPEHVWIYDIENIRTTETAAVPEPEVFFAIFGKDINRKMETKIDAEQLAEDLTEALSEPAFPHYLSVNVRELLHREELEDRARRHGRDLPIAAGDYIRVRGDLRPEMELHHNHYAKVLEVIDPDIGAIESGSGTHAVRLGYRVLLDDGSEATIYDPEVKLHYTSNGRSTILNWRAATFLSESFHDAPPYRVDYSYLEDHVFSRDELEAMSEKDLADLFAEILYVKGRMGLRDLEAAQRQLMSIPKQHLVDGVLAASRFDMRKNRILTPDEVGNKRKDAYKLRRMLKGR
jgi:hypothetical protein